MRTATPFRALVAGLAAMGPVTLRGQEYKGEYLSTLVAINPEHPGEEAARTSQLISELGRLTAAALREKEMADTRYRIWREQVIHEMTNDLEAAENAGFQCARDPGVDSKGKPKRKVCPSRTAVEAYMRTLPEYATHKASAADAEEVHGVLYAAYDAAKARQWAIRAFEASGGTDTGRTSNTYNDNGGNYRHAGHGDVTATQELEQAAVQGPPRTPLPTPPGPPGPPPSQAGPPAPPPPPTRS